MTVKQVANLTGVSVRTLQFYDEIGLLKPAGLTEAGYRLYDENTLETLQQILFFKELDFTLKEVKTIMENPQFDKMNAFIKQRELIPVSYTHLFHSLLICQFYQLPAAAVMTVHQRLHQIMVFFRQLAVTADGSLLFRFAQLTVIPILQEYFLKPS